MIIFGSHSGLKPGRSVSLIAGLVLVGVGLGLFLLTSVFTPQKQSFDSARSLSPQKPAVAAQYAQQPPSFEVNAGQVAAPVQYLARGRGYSLFLETSAVKLSLQKEDRQSQPTAGPSTASPQPQNSATPVSSSTPGETDSAAISMRWLGGNEGVRLSGLDRLSGQTNYLLGNDPAKWHTAISNFGSVRYSQIYRGIDLVLHSGSGRKLEYDFVVAPGADPASIELSFEGAEDLHLNAQGQLELTTPAGTVIQEAPSLYQENGGRRQSVAGRYRLGKVGEGTASQPVVSFEVGQYDQARPLVIDPVLSYSSFLGGSGSDQGQAIWVDEAGYIYLTGSTTSVNFPTAPGASSPNPAYNATPGGGQDAFVTKLNPQGNTVIYSTYLGGSADDAAIDLTVDKTGKAYLIGVTASSNFPVTASALQATYGGSKDAFVSILAANGASLEYSSFLGGSGAEEGRGVRLDDSGNIYVTGRTASANFPTTAGAFDISYNGASTFGYGDIFVTKFGTGGASLVYSTYVGGSADEVGNRIVVDGQGNAYVAVDTRSADFPTTPGAFDTSFNSSSNGFNDAGVFKLNAAGNALVYSTFLGGSSYDYAIALAVDGSGNVYVTGETTNANDFPTTPGAYKTTSSGVGDVFVTKLNPAGSALIFSTYLGGSDRDQAHGIGFDSAGNVYVTGFTYSSNFPTTGDALDPSYNGDKDVFVSRFNPTGTALLYSSFLGGSGLDEANDMKVMPDGTLYITGATYSPAFPTTSGAFDTTHNGDADVFVVRLGGFGPPTDLGLSETADNLTPAQGASVQITITLTNYGPLDATGVEVQDALPAGLSFQSYSTSNGTVYDPLSGKWSVGPLAKNTSITLIITATVTQTSPITNTVTKRGDQADPVAANDTASLTFNPAADVALQKTVNNSTPLVGQPVTFTITAANRGPGAATGVEVSDPLPGGLTYLSAQPSQGSYDQNSGLWKVGGLSNGSSASLQLVARVTQAGTITNTATKTAQHERDSQPNNDSASVGLTARTVADLKLQKTVDNQTPLTSQNVTFTVSLSNQGLPMRRG